MFKKLDAQAQHIIAKPLGWLTRHSGRGNFWWARAFLVCAALLQIPSLITLEYRGLAVVLAFTYLLVYGSWWNHLVKGEKLAGTQTESIRHQPFWSDIIRRLFLILSFMSTVEIPVALIENDWARALSDAHNIVFVLAVYFEVIDSPPGKSVFARAGEWLKNAARDVVDALTPQPELAPIHA